MKMVSPTLFKDLRQPRPWILGIVAGLVAIHLSVLLRVGDVNMLSTSALFWLTTWSLLSPKLRSPQPTSLLSSLVGSSLIGLVLFKSQFLVNSDFFRVSPLLSILGVALLLSGFRGLKQHWRELLLLSFLVPSPVVLRTFFDFSTATAQFATSLLWYLGFEVSRNGIFVYLPNGGIEVYAACSGIDTIFQLLQLAIMIVLMFSATWPQKVLLLLLAILVGFVANSIRVALLAILSTSTTEAVFDYWHTGNGSLIFSVAAVLMFGLSCLFLLRPNQEMNVKAIESKHS